MSASSGADERLVGRPELADNPEPFFCPFRPQTGAMTGA